MGAFSIWHWIIVIAVVILIFGTKKLPTLGSDLGKAIKGFKKAMTEEHNPKLEADQPVKADAERDETSKK